MSKRLHAAPAWLAALACAGLLATGCGGDDASPSAESSSEPTESVAAAGGAGQGDEAGKREKPEAEGGGDRGGGEDRDRADGAGSRGGGTGGESGSSSRPEDPTPTAEAGFVKKANEICTERRAEMLARVQDYVDENKDGGKSEAALQAESIDSIVVPSLETQVREIRELDAPPGRAAEVRAFLAAMEEGIAATKRNRHTAANVEGFGREYRRADRLAQRLGLDACSFGG